MMNDSNAIIQGLRRVRRARTGSAQSSLHNGHRASLRSHEGKNGDPGAIRTRDPQLRRLFRKSCNLLMLLRYSGNLVRSGSAMRCQEVP